MMPNKKGFIIATLIWHSFYIVPFASSAAKESRAGVAGNMSLPVSRREALTTEIVASSLQSAGVESSIIYFTTSNNRNHMACIFWYPKKSKDGCWLWYHNAGTSISINNIDTLNWILKKVGENSTVVKIDKIVTPPPLQELSKGQKTSYPAKPAPHIPQNTFFLRGLTSLGGFGQTVATLLGLLPNLPKDELLDKISGKDTGYCMPVAVCMTKRLRALGYEADVLNFGSLSSPGHSICVYKNPSAPSDIYYTYDAIMENIILDSSSQDPRSIAIHWIDETAAVMPPENMFLAYYCDGGFGKSEKTLPRNKSKNIKEKGRFSHKSLSTSSTQVFPLRVIY